MEEETTQPLCNLPALLRSPSHGALAMETSEPDNLPFPKVTIPN